MAIESFRHKGLEGLFTRGKSAKIRQDMKSRLKLILDFLDGIEELDDCLGVRGFHELTGNRKGTYAMSVTGNYRVTFKYDKPAVLEVDLEDYH